MNNELAILGGKKTIDHIPGLYRSIGSEEKAAVNDVLDSGNLSNFIGAWHPDFFGGKKVKELEKNWAEYFKTQFAISVNSNTSGLMTALGALDLEPGDQVLVTPWSMCATATAILVWNAIPVFVDIEPETFAIDPMLIEKHINEKTKAIVVVNIFGHAAKLNEIITIAKKHGLKVIEDNAQAPGALYQGKYTGTIADIGVFSLNYHKHIHTGEGGVCVTNNPALAERMQLIRNHGEAVVGPKGVTNISNIIGFNFRMGEMEAAIGIEQLKKLKQLTANKTELGKKLSSLLQGLKGLRLPVVQKNSTHVYYTYPMIIDPSEIHISREILISALEKEGVPGIAKGYVNIHRLPMYEKKIAYGKSGYPWSVHDKENKIRYGSGTCPVAESLHDKNFFYFYMCGFELNNEYIELVAEAFHKVWKNISKLENLQKK